MKNNDINSPERFLKFETISLTVQLYSTISQLLYLSYIHTTVFPRK